MCLKTPDFWYGGTGAAKLAAAALAPASFLYGIGRALHKNSAQPYKSKIPVICVGNLTAGGSGKTPVALAVMKLIRDNDMAIRPCFLTRGYGGKLRGPVMIDAHNARDAGDEPQLLDRHSPTIVSADRKAGARLAEQTRHDLIVMDDGLQNPGLEKYLKLVVIDGASGFGNRRLLPAGPLREPLASGLANADAFILIGDDRHDIASTLPADKPLIRAQLKVPATWTADKSRPYIAFCGLARPEKFKATIAGQNLTLAGWHTFPDHHNFTPRDLETLDRAAAAQNARLLTTEKDAARLPPGFSFKNPLDIMPVEIVWDQPDMIKQLLQKTLSLNPSPTGRGKGGA